MGTCEDALRQPLRLGPAEPSTAESAEHLRFIKLAALKLRRALQLCVALGCLCASRPLSRVLLSEALMASDATAKAASAPKEKSDAGSNELKITPQLVVGLLVGLGCALWLLATGLSSCSLGSTSRCRLALD